MPYLLLVIGLILGIFAMYRFFLRAEVREIKALVLAVLIITICMALFVLAVTGRLPAAIAIVAALSPFIIGWFTKRRRASAYDRQVGDSGKPMDEKEARRVLGVDENASEIEIKDAYKKLMKKVHPDQEGSQWMAEKLNEAKDLLLKK
jgi:hypothetical protein